MIPHNKLTFGRTEEDAVQSVVGTGFWAGGEEVIRLENRVKHLVKRNFAIGVSSGLSALRLSLLALGVGRDDEVIIPAYCCVAIPNAVLACGAFPVPVDIVFNEWNINLEGISSKITSKTKAIIVVHTFGLNANIKNLNTLKIPIIEDCAHAIGKISEDLIFGNQAEISIGSFYATKLVGGGEGGVVMTDNKSISDFIFNFRDYTDKKPSGLRLNEKMSNIDASLSLCQLKRLPAMVKKRQEIASFYIEELAVSAELMPDFILPISRERIWYRFVIYCKRVKADIFIEELRMKGISAAKPVENWMDESQILEYPQTLFAYDHLVSIPIYPTLKTQHIRAVIASIKNILKSF